MSRSAEARSEQTGANRRAVAAAFGLSVEGGGGAAPAAPVGLMPAMPGLMPMMPYPGMPMMAPGAAFAAPFPGMAALPLQNLQPGLSMPLQPLQGMQLPPGVSSVGRRRRCR